MFRMLTLYYKPTCPFCRRVLAVIDRLQIQVELKDVNDQAFKDELMNRGKKTQVPYLVDTAGAVEMYESDAIVSYLQTNYGKQSASPVRPRVHIADNVCISCEG